MNWILDFDDTLVVGPDTWALTVIIPELVKAHQLPFDNDQFVEVTLRAQQAAGETNDEQAILNEMFAALGWPDELKQTLMTRMYEEYVPTLYSDSLPFLNRLAAGEHTILVISNNNYAPYIASQLGIDPAFTAIYTPQVCDGARGKPYRDMWDYAVSAGVVDANTPVQVVGDDPWSDGTFANNCGHPCWILDRLKRYDSLHTKLPYQWASTLTDIPME